MAKEKTNEKTIKKVKDGKSDKNIVTVAGYLRENNLEQIKDKNGNNVIRGSVSIADSEFNSVKVNFYANEKNYSGEESPLYNSLLSVLPFNTVSIASALKENPETNFETAKNGATKLYIVGRFDEYATKSGEREDSYVTIKGTKIGLCNENFKPRSEFTVDMSIISMDPELDADEKETGRLVIKGAVPKWSRDGDLVDVIEFVAGTENKVDIADYLHKKCKVGDTVEFCGRVVNLMIRELNEEPEEDPGDTFGSYTEKRSQYITHFVKERIITGGKFGIAPIAVDFVKNGLAARELVKNKNGAKSKASPSNGFSEVKKDEPLSSNGMEELDF